MDRSNPYEAAFEAYLRARRLGYVAVDEAHRSTLDDEPVKSVDFIVHGANGAKLLVDVKGRRFPGGPKERPRRVWETWSTEEDIDGLDRWAERFGDGYRGLLVFVYRIRPMVLLPLG
ncbi:MAG TPA: HYExAFE family protein, partial [Gemmataceae bacterium]